MAPVLTGSSAGLVWEGFVLGNAVAILFAEPVVLGRLTPTKAIDDWAKGAETSPGRRHRALSHIRKFPPKKLAIFTLKVVLDCLSRERAYTATAMQIGARCEDEERYLHFKEDSVDHFDRALRRGPVTSPTTRKRRRHLLKAMSLFGISWPRWSREERCSVGTVLLQLCADHCGIVTVYHAKSKGKKHAELKIGATQEVLEWVEDVNARGSPDVAHAAAVHRGTAGLGRSSVRWVPQHGHPLDGDRQDAEPAGPGHPDGRSDA